MQQVLSLSKDKPKELQDAEHATWLFTFNLSAGLDKAELLESYIKRLHPISAAAVDAGGADFFVRSSSAYYSISLLLT